MHIRPLRAYVDSVVGLGWRLLIQVSYGETSYLVDWGTLQTVSRKDVQGKMLEVAPIENILEKLKDKVALLTSLGVPYSTKDVDQMIFWLNREQSKPVKPKGFARKVA